MARREMARREMPRCEMARREMARREHRAPRCELAASQTLRRQSAVLLRACAALGNPEVPLAFALWSPLTAAEDANALARVSAAALSAAKSFVRPRWQDVALPYFQRRAAPLIARAAVWAHVPADGSGNLPPRPFRRRWISESCVARACVMGCSDRFVRVLSELVPCGAKRESADGDDSERQEAERPPWFVREVGELRKIRDFPETSRSALNGILEGRSLIEKLALLREACASMEPGPTEAMISSAISASFSDSARSSAFFEAAATSPRSWRAAVRVAQEPVGREMGGFACEIALASTVHRGWGPLDELGGFEAAVSLAASPACNADRRFLVAKSLLLADSPEFVLRFVRAVETRMKVRLFVPPSSRDRFSSRSFGRALASVSESRDLDPQKAVLALRLYMCAVMRCPEPSEKRHLFTESGGRLAEQFLCHLVFPDASAPALVLASSPEWRGCGGARSCVKTAVKLTSTSWKRSLGPRMLAAVAVHAPEELVAVARAYTGDSLQRTTCTDLARLLVREKLLAAVACIKSPAHALPLLFALLRAPPPVCPVDWNSTGAVRLREKAVMQAMTSAAWHGNVDILFALAHMFPPLATHRISAWLSLPRVEVEGGVWGGWRRVKVSRPNPWTGRSIFSRFQTLLNEFLDGLNLADPEDALAACVLCVCTFEMTRETPPLKKRGLGRLSDRASAAVIRWLVGVLRRSAWSQLVIPTVLRCARSPHPHIRNFAARTYREFLAHPACSGRRSGGPPPGWRFPFETLPGTEAVREFIRELKLAAAGKRRGWKRE